MTDAPVLHWFRRDLRLTDNTALNAALESGSPVACVFILDTAILKSDRLGLPRLAFMLDGLRALDAELRQRNSRLIVRHGRPARVLKQLVDELKATAIFFNRDISPYARRRDQQVKDAVGVPVHDFDDVLLRAPGEVMKKDRTPYTIYTPFRNRWLAERPIDDAAPLRHGQFFSPSSEEAGTVPTLQELGFSSTIAVPEATEAVAQKRLKAFVQKRVLEYDTGRNWLAPDPFGRQPGGTSGISPYLRLGMLSPRQAYHAALDAAGKRRHQTGIDTWIGELIWRDFYGHILYHFPHEDGHYFREQFARIPYRTSKDELRAWQDGTTGYPIVDAAMRQLQAIGWMPNRARLIVSAFLVKDLLVDWREGEKHFRNWLLDGDPAANIGNWQWAAGSGADAQPFFRIFTPVGQSKKFDKRGDYIRYWIPELKDVPTRYIHEPWTMPEPPKNYPPPVVDHEFARDRALDAYRTHVRKPRD